MKNIKNPKKYEINLEHTRTSMTKEGLQRAFVDNLFYLQGRFPEVATTHDLYMSAAYTVRDRMLERWIKSARAYREMNSRTVCYLSAEYLLGPHMSNNLINLGIMKKAKKASQALEIDIQAILDEEEEPGLGNGGLGRLAACYMDSLATNQIPAIGYGIRYEFGIFDQVIEDGWQVEVSDVWLRNGNPWELRRTKLRYGVCFGGHTEQVSDNGHIKVKWHPELVINGVAYDTPILGYGVDNSNLLRLWTAEAPKSFDFTAFNTGDYYGAVHTKVEAENISKVLYPNDEPEAGKELRLKQQYFFVSCSLQDMIRIHLKRSNCLSNFYEKFTAQLNDTHPSLAIPELMRLLIDEHHMEWEFAWEITQKTFAFTNHTLLPEALETWSVALLERLLPRHMQIIYEINRRFTDQMRIHFFNDQQRIANLSIIDEQRRVRMAHLATVGSYAVNGVASLHTELLKSTVMTDFSELWPDKFYNVTNGISPRRFLVISNPGLTDLITEACGSDEWIRNLECVQEITQFVDDPSFIEKWRLIKLNNKRKLSNWLLDKTGVLVDHHSIFDVQAKRIHEYKRQHLNILHVISFYLQLKENTVENFVPRTFIFGGKAAPGYKMAKLIIKLINSVGEVVNSDPAMKDKLSVIFLPNFNVKNSQFLYPAADLSEQISLAGKEASGTGNMKFSMNGALTIGTLDGANVEIRQEVGEDNFFLFGLTSEQVHELQLIGYDPAGYYENNPSLKSAIDLIDSGYFSHGDTELFRPLTANLLERDPYMVLADFDDYIKTQTQVSSVYQETKRWNQMSILNVARIGKFSSDRAIREYCDKIWKVDSVNVDI